MFVITHACFSLYLQFQALRAMVQANPQILQVCPSLINVSNPMFFIAELAFRIGIFVAANATRASQTKPSSSKIDSRASCRVSTANK